MQYVEKLHVMITIELHDIMINIYATCIVI